jgi:hypothetical protein
VLGPMIHAHSCAHERAPTTTPAQISRVPSKRQFADQVAGSDSPKSVRVPGPLKYSQTMVGRNHGEFLAAVREAAGDADHDGTAALNGLLFGGALMVASSVTLVTVGGPAGVMLWALIWAVAVGGVALWLAPHIRRVRSWNIEQAEHRRAFIEIARQRAVDLLLHDDTPEPERRAAAALLDESESAGDA